MFMNCNKKSHFDGMTLVQWQGGFGYVSVCKRGAIHSELTRDLERGGGREGERGRERAGEREREREGREGGSERKSEEWR